MPASEALIKSADPFVQKIEKSNESVNKLNDHDIDVLDKIVVEFGEGRYGQDGSSSEIATAIFHIVLVAYYVAIQSEQERERLARLDLKQAIENYFILTRRKSRADCTRSTP